MLSSTSETEGWRISCWETNKNEKDYNVKEKNEQKKTIKQRI